MLRIPESYTVAQWREMEKANPQLPQAAHRATCTNYSDFVTTLYVEIDTIVDGLERDANVLQASTENSLNADICRQLCRLGYTAVHDKNHRGHTDISVEFERYSWVGEGKKVASVNNSHLKDGYDQLVHRYVTGTSDADQAAVVVYCFAKDAAHVTAQWKAHLKACNSAVPGYAENIQPCQGNAFAFWTESKHESSGRILKIKHIVLSLHWAPPK